MYEFFPSNLQIDKLFNEGKSNGVKYYILKDEVKEWLNFNFSDRGVSWQQPTMWHYGLTFESKEHFMVFKLVWLV